jgi:hypothetical protein
MYFPGSRYNFSSQRFFFTFLVIIELLLITPSTTRTGLGVSRGRFDGGIEITVGARWLNIDYLTNEFSANKQGESILFVWERCLQPNSKSYKMVNIKLIFGEDSRHASFSVTDTGSALVTYAAKCWGLDPSKLLVVLRDPDEEISAKLNQTLSTLNIEEGAVICFTLQAMRGII